MSFEQPKPDSKTYRDIVREMNNGIIKIPKFQREFVWSLDKTAKLLDSILKGYPIGIFILWETSERINDIKNVGDINIPDAPKRKKVEYVLDGQQRIISLFAAYCGANIQRTGKKEVTDYSNIFVNLDQGTDVSDGQIITVEPVGEKYLSLHDVLHFDDKKSRELSDRFNKKELGTIDSYKAAFEAYKFSTVLLRKEDIDSAIEVFARINTGGQTMTLFEIMSAKTYDEQREFDMQVKWNKFIEKLREKEYDGVSNTVILSVLSLVLSPTKECKRKTILSLDKNSIIERWDAAISAIWHSVEHFRAVYGIPASELLPYDALLIPFAYFFYLNEDNPNADQRKFLKEFFWRMSLSSRYSSPSESKLAEDIKRIDLILGDKDKDKRPERPKYSDIDVRLDTQSLIDTNFSTDDSYCKAVLCLYVSQEPKDFRDNGKIVLDNSLLKKADGKNYHHFFPKDYLENKTHSNANSVINITFVTDHLNKRKIGSRAPSDYIKEFKDENPEINKALNSHFIDIDTFGIESDDYNTFLKSRAERVYSELKARINLSHAEPANEKIRELISSGESETVEFKATLRFDLNTEKVETYLEDAIGKAIAAFLNSKGGHLFIGVDNEKNALGLDNDIGSLEKKNIDGFQLHLGELIGKYIGNGFIPHIEITFPNYDGKQICHVRVKPSHAPVFTTFKQGQNKEKRQTLIIRSDCASKPLEASEQNDYIKAQTHWE